MNIKDKQSLLINFYFWGVDDYILATENQYFKKRMVNVRKLFLIPLYIITCKIPSNLL